VNPHSHRIFLIAPVVMILACAFLSSCHRANTAAAMRYPFTGRVISVDPQAQSALIDGDAIPGFMDAMAMPYKVKPAATLNHLLPGDSISAEVVSEPEDDNGRSDYWLENVKVTAHSSAPAAGASSPHTPVPREQVPDFSFVNQDGKSISLVQYRGKVLLVTFIYTRCPFPDFCPRMSANFAQIYQQLAIDPALANVHLLSISFDPGHDNPKVLRDYGFSVAHTHDAALFRRWEFAVPRQADLPKIADFFALTVKPEGGLITHNLSTAVIGPDGKIVEWYHGGDWQISDLMNHVENVASGFSPP
jgi:protein SCO1/2